MNSQNNVTLSSLITKLENASTYGKLKALLPSTDSQKLPGIRQLQKSATIVLRGEAQFGIIEVYDNGFCSYTDGRWITVLAVDRCDQLRDDDSPEDVFYVKREVYEDQPWMIPLEIAGIYALSNNAGCREKRKAPVSLDDPSLANNIRFSIPPEHVLREEMEEEQNRKEKKNRQIAHEYQKLLPRQKEIVRMVCLEKKLHQEAAECLGIDRTGVTHSLSGIKKRFDKFV